MQLKLNAAQPVGRGRGGGELCTTLSLEACTARGHLDKQSTRQIDAGLQMLWRLMKKALQVKGSRTSPLLANPLLPHLTRLCVNSKKLCEYNCHMPLSAGTL